jgi:hypothetical protein
MVAIQMSLLTRMLEMPKHPGGRPTEYRPDICKRVEQYLEERKDTVDILGEQKLTIVRTVNLPTIEDLANYLGIHKDTIYDWEKKYPEFSDVITRVRQEQASRLINNGLSGSYNPQIAKVLLTKHGYVEKQELDQKVTGDVQFINKVPRPDD